MNNSLLKTFYNYSYIMDEAIFKDILKKLDEKDKEKLENIDKLFKKFNTLITMEDILYIVAKLETNTFIIDNALKGADDGLEFHIRVMNEETQKLVRELFVMLEGKKIVYEK